MTSLHLPVAHTPDDIAMAGALAQLLRSEELYVAWSTDGGAAKPVVDALLTFEEDATPDPAPVRLRPPTLFERLLDYWRGT